MNGQPVPALQRTAGPVLLWGLGVGSVISGDYFGWNFGLAAGGFSGLAVATVVMATLYVAMMFSLAELAAAIPVAGGPYAFARRALGPWGGFATGLAVTIEYVVAPATIATGVGGYAAGLWPAHADAVAAWAPLVAYAAFVGLNLLGSRLSLRVLFVVTAVAALALVVWSLAVLPYVDFSRLFDLPPDPGHDATWPRGAAGIVAALPAAAWFYLAIESVPLAAEETVDPARSLPRGMLAAMATLVALSVLVLVLAPAATGTAVLARSGNPLPEAVAAVAGRGFVYGLTTAVGLLGLLASFFSLVFAYSRQIFALSRAGYLPRWLSRTNRFHAPHYALVVPALIGYGILRGVDVVAAGRVATADLLVQIAVFCALVSYVLMMVSHLVLRVRAPDLPRPYRTPGGPVLPLLALVLALGAMTSSLFHAEAASWVVAGAIGLLALGMAYFALVSRHRLVAGAPEEEAALVRAAEAELDGSAGP